VLEENAEERKAHLDRQPLDRRSDRIEAELHRLRMLADAGPLARVEGDEAPLLEKSEGLMRGRLLLMGLPGRELAKDAVVLLWLVAEPRRVAADGEEHADDPPASHRPHGMIRSPCAPRGETCCRGGR
jgi:hypothetical protein